MLHSKHIRIKPCSEVFGEVSNESGAILRPPRSCNAQADTSGAGVLQRVERFGEKPR